MRKFFSEFKKFITRGNVIDMAVGVIIGGAFSAIVTALTNNILMPLINAVLFAITGGKGLENVYTYLHKAYLVTDPTQIDLANSIYIDWGAFISAIINFLLIALVLFMIIKAINSVHEGINKQKGKYAPLTKDEIRALRKEGKTREQIVAAATEKKAALEREEAEKKAAEEAAKANVETEADLLKEIRDLLKNQK